MLTCCNKHVEVHKEIYNNGTDNYFNHHQTSDILQSAKNEGLLTLNSRLQLKGGHSGEQQLHKGSNAQI